MAKVSHLATAITINLSARRLSFATIKGNSAQSPILPHRLFKCSRMLSSAARRQWSQTVGVSVNISPGVEGDKRVEKISQMRREDVRGELSLGEFAQSVNLSVWRLCHIFKSDVGMPPIRYLRLL